MTRLHTTAAALLVFALATSGCARNRNLPSQLAPSKVTNIGVNSYLWRAAIDTVSFAPLLQANPNSGVIITDWYSPPEAPDSRFKANVFILDRQLRADGIKVTLFQQKRDANGGWVDAEVNRKTATDLEDAILTRARQLRIASAAAK